MKLVHSMTTRYIVIASSILSTTLGLNAQNGGALWPGEWTGDAHQLNHKDQIIFSQMMNEGLESILTSSGSSAKSDRIRKVLHKALEEFYGNMDPPASINEKYFQLLTDYKNKDTMRFFECDNCWSVFNFESIWGYGCWCIFGSYAHNLTPGGTVQDPIDNVCKDLQQCYRCANIDTVADSGERCDSMTEEYNFDLTINFFPVPSIQMTCTDPEDSCKHRTCMCDSDFINTLLGNQLVVTPGLEHKDSSGAEMFDFANSCTTVPSGSKRECCGSYPKRRPYSNDDNVECCQDTTIYNNINTVCCDDGTVVGTGDVCA